MSQSFLTLAAIFYDQVTPYNAALFYNVYGEIILEFLLSAFWITSFAGLAGYVVQMSAPVSDLNSYVSPSGPDYGDPNVTNLAAHSTQAQDVCIAIVVLGAIVLCVCSLSTIPPRRDYLRAQVTSVLTLANIMSLIAYIVRVERGPEEEQHTGESMSPSPGHVETSVIQDKTPPQMPTSFQEV